MSVRHLCRPQIQRLIRRTVVSRVVQRLRVVVQRRRAAARGVGARESRRGFRETTHAVIERARRHRGIGALLERERLLERAQGVFLAEDHLQRFAEEHPGVGMIGKANARFPRCVHRAPAIVERAREVDERRERVGVAGRKAAAQLQPGDRAARRLALASGGAAGAVAREGGAKVSQHCLIMSRATVRLQRRMGSALQGRRIVVTRAREQAGDLVRALEDRGAVAVLAPVIRIQPLENLGALRAALTGLSAYRWVVFTSQNAVQVVFDRLVAWGLTPRVFATTSVAAIGTATAAALTVRGVVPALVPPEFVAESLASALIEASGGSLVGSRVLVPTAEDAREVLAVGLRDHGATVETIAVYRTVPVQTDLAPLAAEITRGRIDAVTFTSSSTVRSFVDLVGRPAATSGKFVTATIGPVTAGTARELGLRDVVEAEPHTVPGLVETLARRFA